MREKVRILPVMVGTAGHVDHGKTALVRNLTGCETDTLREEKERGLTIDLGFAPCQLPGGRLCGIIDVPGHKDFIRNMVAGAASMNVVILVVAADDGVMPQTVEHLKVVSLLRTPRLLVALTKIDLVDSEIQDLARNDVSEHLSRMGYPGVPIIPVSNQTFVGIQTLKETLDSIVEKIEDSDSTDELFRMSVERTFSIKGHGTVVTGIPVSGRVYVGDKVELLPAGLSTTVRSIQSYSCSFENVEANVCGALVLKDIDVRDVERGMVVASSGAFRAVTQAVVRIRNVSDNLRLKRTTPFKFHSGTAVVGATGRLISHTTLEPGQDGFLELKFAAPIVLACQDRYVVRTLTPPATVGGGAVLSIQGPSRMKAADPVVQLRLGMAGRAVDRKDPLMAELALAPSPVVAEKELACLSQRSLEPFRRLLQEREEKGEVLGLGAGMWLLPERLVEVVATIESALTRYHDAHPYAWGMEPASVCHLLDLPGACFSRLVSLVCFGTGLVCRHGRLALSSFSPRLSLKQRELMERLVDQVGAAGLAAPARGDLLTRLGIEEGEMALLVKLLVEEGTLAIVDNHLLLKSLFDRLRQQLLSLFESKGVVDILAFREATGVNRRMAQSVLEAFDAEGLTRRVEAGRVLAKPSSD